MILFVIVIVRLHDLTEKSVVFQATVIRGENKRVETYVGLTADSIKVR